MSGGRVLVTGANGHIGGNVVRELLDTGYTPVAFVRKGADLRALEHLDLERVEGDILDAESVRACVRGCRFVLHLAAVNRPGDDEADAVMRPAIEGNENVLRAAAEAGVERVVFTSSTVAVGIGSNPDEVRDERHWNEDRTLPYSWAKTLGERRTCELAEELGIEAVAINPSSVLGGYDYRITPVTRVVRALLEGTVQTGLGGWSYVDVRDVARAHVRALTRAEPGERYIVSSVNITLKAFGETLTEMTGIGVTHLPAPRWLAMPLMRTVAGVNGLLGREPALTVAQARVMVDRYAYYDGSKATSELGLQYADLREILDQTIRWLVFVGALQSRTLHRLGGRFNPDESWRP